MSKRLTAVIHREGEGFVALCPELDIASQGDSIEAARDNLREALELFFECASPAEIQGRLGEEVFVTQVEVACELASGTVGSGSVCDHGASRVYARPSTGQPHCYSARDR
jgi:predicted RNase H-like HicB family nuclease